MTQTEYEIEFSFTQEEVNAFAELTGDFNPIHFEGPMATEGVFGKPILHGMLSASIFSRIFGTTFPGPGTVYLNQNLRFLRPMFADTKYTAKVSVIEAVEKGWQIKLATTARDASTKKIVMDGIGEVMSKAFFTQKSEQAQQS
jgi:acyl dehydratase